MAKLLTKDLYELSDALQRLEHSEDWKCYLKLEGAILTEATKAALAPRLTEVNPAVTNAYYQGKVAAIEEIQARRLEYRNCKKGDKLHAYTD